MAGMHRLDRAGSQVPARTAEKATGSKLVDSGLDLSLPPPHGVSLGHTQTLSSLSFPIYIAKESLAGERDCPPRHGTSRAWKPSSPVHQSHWPT